jgi:hypothetical protein
MRQPRDHVRRRGHRITYNRSSHRLHELERIIGARHGMLLNTDDFDLYVTPVAQTLRHLHEIKNGLATYNDVLDRLMVWAPLHTPLLSEEQLREAAREAMRRPNMDCADALAGRLKLTYAERQFLKITSIGSFDVNKVGRTRLRKERKRLRDRARDAAKRATRGVTPRSQSLSRTRPWEAEGICRRTWERHRKVDPALASAFPPVSQIPRVASCLYAGRGICVTDEASGIREETNEA